MARELCNKSFGMFACLTLVILHCSMLFFVVWRMSGGYVPSPRKGRVDSLPSDDVRSLPGRFVVVPWQKQNFNDPMASLRPIIEKVLYFALTRLEAGVFWS